MIESGALFRTLASLELWVDEELIILDKCRIQFLSVDLWEVFGIRSHWKQ